MGAATSKIVVANAGIALDFLFKISFLFDIIKKAKKQN